MWDVRPIPDLAAGQLALFLAALSPERRQRYARLQEEARRASLFGDRLAREQAARLCHAAPQTLQIMDGPYGRPLLAGGEAQISVAHSGSFVAAAAAREPLGIDLEQLRPAGGRLIARVCSPEERRWVGGDAARFLRLWTMKEAYGKRLGMGIFSNQRFFARFDGAQLLLRYPDCRFLLPEAPPGYLLSLCLS